MRTVESKILLKARPTPSQLADRLAPPIPEGLELYLDRTDLLDPGLVDAIRHRDRETDDAPDFVWIVEAPIRTLGDRFFDLTVGDEDHRETIRRVVEVGSAIGAVAANVHVVAPSLDSATLSADNRRRKLDQAGSLLTYYVDQCRDASLIPQVENVPPVGRMREGALVYSSIGTIPADLISLCESYPELRITFDTSHAGLYLNWCKARQSELEGPSRAAAAFYQSTPGPGTLGEFANLLGNRVTTVHVSNAAGLLGEGLRYADGEFDLDRALVDLIGVVPYLVTETLEPDPNCARDMREVQRRLSLLRRQVCSGAPM